MRDCVREFLLPLVAILLWLTPAVSGAPIEYDTPIGVFVEVGDPGNACETQPQGCFGAVADSFQIAKYETTNALYTSFLNAVAATDSNGLYNTMMGLGAYGGIARSGSSGSYTYSTRPGRADNPVNYVSFYDAMRFVNWVENGQPVGLQGNATTEDGSYTITAAGIAANSIVLNPGSVVALPSEDQWYKAAYYDALSLSYFDYPASSDSLIGCTTPGATANTGNCNYSVYDVTGVGGYTGSASPYGTFDQGGNVWEWNHTIDGTNRGLRGGSWDGDGVVSAGAANGGTLVPTLELSTVGFRVVTPEPGTGLLVMIGMLGLAGCRRGRARA